MSLVNKVSSGQLQSTPQLRSELSASLGSLINQGQPATVFSMSHQDFDSAYGRLQKGLQFLTASTGNSMSEQQLAQLKKDVGALQSEYAVQHETKYNAFREGMPEQFTPKLDNRYKAFRKGVGIASEGDATANQQAPQVQAPPQQSKGLISGLIDKGAGMLGYGPKTQAQAATSGPPGGIQTRQQNGHTYTWNPQTGKYE
jgi:hypothetical protein